MIFPPSPGGLGETSCHAFPWNVKGERFLRRTGFRRKFGNQDSA